MVETIERFIAWDSMRRQRNRMAAQLKRDIKRKIPEKAVQMLEQRIKAVESAMEKV